MRSDRDLCECDGDRAKVKGAFYAPHYKGAIGCVHSMEAKREAKGRPFTPEQNAAFRKMLADVVRAVDPEAIYVALMLAEATFRRDADGVEWATYYRNAIADILGGAPKETT